MIWRLLKKVLRRVTTDLHLLYVLTLKIKERQGITRITLDKTEESLLHPLPATVKPPKRLKVPVTNTGNMGLARAVAHALINIQRVQQNVLVRRIKAEAVQNHQVKETVLLVVTIHLVAEPLLVASASSRRGRWRQFWSPPLPLGVDAGRVEE